MQRASERTSQTPMPTWKHGWPQKKNNIFMRLLVGLFVAQFNQEEMFATMNVLVPLQAFIRFVINRQ